MTSSLLLPVMADPRTVPWVAPPFRQLAQLSETRHIWLLLQKRADAKATFVAHWPEQNSHTTLLLVFKFIVEGAPVHEVELSHLVCLAPRSWVALVVHLCGQMGHHLRHKHRVQVVQIPARGAVSDSVTDPRQAVLQKLALSCLMLRSKGIQMITATCTPLLAYTLSIPGCALLQASTCLVAQTLLELLLSACDSMERSYTWLPEAYHMFSEAACVSDTPKSAGSMGRRMSISESTTRT